MSILYFEQNEALVFISFCIAVQKYSRQAILSSESRLSNPTEINSGLCLMSDQDYIFQFSEAAQPTGAPHAQPADNRIAELVVLRKRFVCSFVRRESF